MPQFCYFRLSLGIETFSLCILLRMLVLKVSLSFASLTRERYFQHSNIKFVSPRGHVISSIYFTRRVMTLTYYITFNTAVGGKLGFLRPILWCTYSNNSTKCSLGENIMVPSLYTAGICNLKTGQCNSVPSF